MPFEAKDAPGLRIYYDADLVYVAYALILFGLAAVVVTLYKLLSKNTSRFEKYILLVVWAIVPPMWFLIEYFFVFLPYGVENSFKYFDYGQSVAAKLWGAVSALIALVIYKDNEKEKEGKEERKEKDESEDSKAKQNEFE